MRISLDSIKNTKRRLCDFFPNNKANVTYPLYNKVKSKEKRMTLTIIFTVFQISTHSSGLLSNNK